MSTLAQRANDIRLQFEQALTQAKTVADLEQVRITFLGRSGHLHVLMEELKALPVEQKKEVGPILNELKKKLQADFLIATERVKEAQEQARATTLQNFDVTAYQPGLATGSLHPLTYVRRRVEDLFVSMGFALAEGPELETEWYNFEALNIPGDHPARDMQDTLWLELPGHLMRTHTSSVQGRYMQQHKPPFAIFATGRCYRHEATDATHDYVFMQVEGLLVGKDISLAHLLGTLKCFLADLFAKEDVQLRLRPSYFPFVEPAVEVDMQCPFCTAGCSTCKHSGWIEILGAGLVHPAVLENFGIDSKEYSGLAFGPGLTRLAMLKYGIPDIRLLHSESLEFLKQF